MAAPLVPPPSDPDPTTPGALAPKQPAPPLAPISTPGKAALVFLATQMPVVGGAITALASSALAAWAKDHLGATLLLVIGYEVMLVIVGVFRKVWGNLEAEIVKGLTEGARLLAGAARARLLNFVSRYRRHYLRRMCLDHRSFNVRGLRTQGAFAIHLEHVFVEVRIAPNSVQQASFSPLGGKDLSGSRPIWDFVRQMAKGEGEALAILGAPGSGKTTLLQHVALTLANHRQRRHKLRAYIPIFLALRDHTAAIVGASPPSLGELAQTYFAKKLDAPPPPSWFERQLRNGACLVLLDGLDEVATDEDRVRVSAWVDQQITTYSGSPFALTARPRGYATAPLARAHVLEILPFGAEQVRSFVRNWYLANETMRAGGQEDEGVRRTAQNQANDLLHRLHSRPALSDLTRNPLLLTMIATVHSQRNALPEGRVELYGEICDVLLGHWQRAKGLAQSLSVGQIRGALEPLAAHMMREGVREMRTAEVLAEIQGPLAEMGVHGDAVATFLPILQAASGLFVQREQDAWGFAHLSFQEYLASSHLRKHGIHSDWSALIQDSWWHETLRLYAAQGDATALLQAGISLDTIPALSLASECLEEAQRIEPTLRGEVEQRLVTDLESLDAARWRIAAEVRLARRLRRLQQIDDNTEIDPEYISNIEYQLFLDDKRRGNALPYPDHWLSERFPPGDAKEVISGVRLEDACDFTEWLTTHYGGNAIYRLPTSQEATHQPIGGPKPMATWCLNGSAADLIGLTDEQEKSIRESMRSLSTLDLPQGIVRAPTLVSQLTLSTINDFRSSLYRINNKLLDLVDTMSHIMNHKFTKVLDRKPIINIARNITSDEIYDITRSIANNLVSINSITQFINRTPPVTLARARDIDSARATAASLNRELSRIFALFLGFAGIVDICSTRHITSAPTRHLTHESISKAFDVMETSEFLSDFFPKPLLTLIRTVTKHPINENAPADQRTHYLYFAGLMEAAWNASRANALDTLPWYRRWIARARPISGRADEASNEFLTLHWWAQLTLARLDGRLPAWEGIRVVRERLP